MENRIGQRIIRVRPHPLGPPPKSRYLVTISPLFVGSEVRCGLRAGNADRAALIELT